MTARRGQTAVVGVALLLAMTVLSLAALTATIGTVVEDSSRAAETGRVVRGFDAALDPHAGTPHERRIAVSAASSEPPPERSVSSTAHERSLSGGRTPSSTASTPLASLTSAVPSSRGVPGARTSASSHPSRRARGACSSVSRRSGPTA
ncbi:hypothetical protein ACFQJD_19050 [Haloplanus sp. GCM10025708]|uniref:DUF7289 family protein n=1 Tax=Haloplanus sp. GCM10025708 TaxID=3252679 RepID=UPI00361D489A